MGQETVRLAGLAELVAALRAAGYRVIGPTVRDGAIGLAELDSAEALPYGWGVELAPGGYRLRRRADRAAFAHSAGPQSWKSFLHPPRERLLDLTRAPTGELTVAEPAADPPRYAFLGVRPCDLRAIAVQDRVLGRGADSRYAARRADVLLVAVDCTEPGETCFCAATGSGPGAGPGYDLLLTELVEAGGEPAYLARAGSPVGEPPPRRWRGRPTGWAAACRPGTCPACSPERTTRPAGTRWPGAASPAATAPWSAPPASVPPSPTPPI